MKQRDLDRLNAYFQKWKGARVFLNTYVNYDDGVDRFRIVFERFDGEKHSTGILFFHCVFLSGSTSWLNGDIQCQLADIEGDVGFEVRDESNGFILRCGGPIVAGDNEVTLSFDQL